jgi:hypothetical protein
LIPTGAVVAQAGDHTNDPVERINAAITLS